jgi:hypothetical protein
VLEFFDAGGSEPLGEHVTFLHSARRAVDKKKKLGSATRRKE